VVVATSLEDYLRGRQAPSHAHGQDQAAHRFIEIIGTYEPRQEPSRINLDNEKALKWLRNGAQPTETVEKILKISGAWETFTAGKAK